MKRSLVVKIGVGALAIAVFAFLFMRSIDETRSTPYTVERQHLRGWTLAIEPAANPGDPLLAVRPSQELASSLFRQIFSRAMESMNAPVAPAVPLVLRAEFDKVVRDQLTPETLLTAARMAGLESASMTPRCVVHRRVSEPGGTQQVYFVVFDAPAVSQFRQQLGLDPAALAPILFVAGAGTDFNKWLPQRVNVDADCLAPIEIVN